MNTGGGGGGGGIIPPLKREGGLNRGFTVREARKHQQLQQEFTSRKPCKHVLQIGSFFVFPRYDLLPTFLLWTFSIKNILQILGKPCQLSNERRCLELLTIKEFIQSTQRRDSDLSFINWTDTIEFLFSKAYSEFVHFVLHVRSMLFSNATKRHVDMFPSLCNLVSARQAMSEKAQCSGLLNTVTNNFCIFLKFLSFYRTEK